MEHEEFQLKVISALTRLETNMDSLVGNGQPGRVKELEDKVGFLQKIAWVGAGVLVAVSAIIHFVFRY